MKNKSLSIFLATVVLLSFSTFAQAAKNDGGGSGAMTGSSSQGSVANQKAVTATSPSQPVVQVQNQVKTQMPWLS